MTQTDKEALGFPKRCQPAVNDVAHTRVAAPIKAMSAMQIQAIRSSRDAGAWGEDG
jgi:hypothetical protein